MIFQGKGPLPARMLWALAVLGLLCTVQLRAEVTLEEARASLVAERQQRWDYERNQRAADAIAQGFFTLDRDARALRLSPAALIRRYESQGFEPTIAAPWGDTPLMYAAAGGQCDSVDALVAAGVPVNAADIEGNTALWYAAKQGQIAALEHLVAGGADLRRVTAGNRTLLHVAVGFDQAPDLQTPPLPVGRYSFCGMPDPPRRCDTLAVQMVYIPVLDWCLAHGLDINTRDGNGNTALHTISPANVAALDGLIARGADPMLRNDEGQTALEVHLPTAEMGDYLRTMPPDPTGPTNLDDWQAGLARLYALQQGGMNRAAGLAALLLSLWCWGGLGWLWRRGGRRVWMAVGDVGAREARSRLAALLSATPEECEAIGVDPTSPDWQAWRQAGIAVESSRGWLLAVAAGVLVPTLTLWLDPVVRIFLDGYMPLWSALGFAALGWYFAERLFWPWGPIWRRWRAAMGMLLTVSWLGLSAWCAWILLDLALGVQPALLMLLCVTVQVPALVAWWRLARGYGALRRLARDGGLQQVRAAAQAALREDPIDVPAGWDHTVPMP